ncbi:MAG: glycosyltransferase [Desulfobacteraceae bacterium]|jgi:glycosyltransferase involved in cell wall biosynthesis
MRIIYPHPMVLPNKLAHSIQIMHTCWELASQGVMVDLMVKKVEKKSSKECLKVYGLSEHKNLRIYGKRKRTHRSIFFFKVLIKAWRHRNDKNTIIFLRDKKLARLLNFFKYLIKIPCVFESHGISYLVLKDKLIREKQIPLLDLCRKKIKIWKTYRLERYIYRKVDGIICTTHGSKEVIHEKFSNSIPTQIIYNATRMTAKKNIYNRKNILYLGQLYPQKGVDVLIEALQYLPQRKLIIIGGNKKEDVERIQGLCEKLGDKDRVKITGYVEPWEIEKYFDQIGVGVIPILDLIETRLFTSPLKIFDYMAAKIPIVASDLPSIRAVLTDGETGILVEPDNPKKLAQGIERVLSDQNLAEKLSAQAYRKALDFTWSKRSQKLISFLASIIDNKNSSLLRVTTAPDKSKNGIINI